MLSKLYSIQAINNHMSLRLPQYESLEILADLMNSLDFQQTDEELQKVIHGKYPIFREFERSFPSLTFALATGVGKTVLMGAFITYLYTNHGIKNFFIVAPNLTVYNKLTKDFSDHNFRKYVFKRLNVFSQRLPNVITGETYKEHGGLIPATESSITINIFNIGKINAEVRGGKEPQVKRPWEVLGQSYFDYLVKLPDLVVLMDESHHYRADRGMAVINELNPLLGLELTATPQVETSRGAIKFKNVVYEYSLAKAINDGFVKEPAAATRKNFDTKKYNPDEIDQIKLTDGVRIHRNTQAELVTYAANEGVSLVKPFVLVVCKDTVHAGEIMQYLTSNDFYDGYYSDKVIELHSNQRGSEKDENIQQLLSLEAESNKIEIVVHVNMLKEGWDVTNLYTIIPLRTAASLTLREQTIGRGLRLPYGKRTGNPIVDRVTIVAHDKFEEIINAANEANSIIRQENIILIDDEEDLGRDKVVVRPPSQFDNYVEQMEQNNQYVRSDEKKKEIKESVEATKAVGLAIDEILSSAVNITVKLSDASEVTLVDDPASRAKHAKLKEKVITTIDLEKPEVAELILEKAKRHLEKDGQLRIDIDEMEAKIKSVIAPAVEQKIRFTIDIPDIVVIQTNQQTKIYKDFDLCTDHGLDFNVPTAEIIIESLKNNEITTLSDDIPIVLPDSLENIIIGEILNLAMGVNFRQYEELFYKLAEQALAYIGENKNQTGLEKTIYQYKKDVAKRIWEQMESHSKLSPPEYSIKLIRAATPILQQDYTKFKDDEIVKYTVNIPANEIRKKIVGHFEKACHTAYKFDSVPEHTFSIMLERSEGVLKWLRPALGQFKIYYSGTRQYQPDFVVETTDSIYIVEIKASNRIDDLEVKLKREAAQKYCDNVNVIYEGTGAKSWKYMLLLDTELGRSVDFSYLEKRSQ